MSMYVSNYGSFSLRFGLSQVFYLDDVQFGQQVAIGQRQLVSVQKTSPGHLFFLHAVGVDLVRQRAIQVFVQLLHSPRQTFLQG